MRIVLLIVFSLYLLVGAFYSLYGGVYCDVELPMREIVYRAVWHISRGLILMVFSVFLAYMTFDTTLRKMSLVVVLYEAVRIVFHTLSIFGVSSVGSIEWCGFSFLFIFVMALILLFDE